VASNQAASDDEEFQRRLVELRVYEGSARALQERLQIVNAALSEFAVASATLEGVKTQKTDEDALIPVGGGSYVRARLSDISKIVVGVGAGVAMEKPIDESITEIKSRLADLEKARTAIGEQLNQAMMKVEENRAVLGEFVKRRGGDSITVL
jgi:prefoldin alpha subunit